MSILNILLKKYFYDRHLFFNKKDIKIFQKKQLKKLLKYTYKNSKFYREIYLKEGIKYNDIDNIEINDLPIVKKSIIMENFDKVITQPNITKKEIIDFIENNPDPKSLYINKFHVIHSSGTSGEIGYYLYNKNSWELLKAVAVSRLFNNFDINRKTYAFIGAVDGHYAGISLFLSPVNKLEQYFYKDFIIIDVNLPLEKYFKKLNKSKPDVLSGYPSVINMYADYQKEGKLNIYPKTIICGGEPLTKTVRNNLNNVWDLNIVNFYGTSESILIGAGINEKGLYLFDDLNIIEIKKDHILLTNLYNYVEPLIRYKIDDVLIINEDNNKKWPFKYIDNIVGREEDFIWLLNEKGKLDFIHPIVFVEIHIKGIKKYQIIKINDEKVKFKAVVKKNKDLKLIKSNICNTIKDILRKKEMSNVLVNIEFTDQIINDPKTGKFQLIKNS